MPRRRRHDSQPDLFSQPPALSPTEPVASTMPRTADPVAALAELDDAGLTRLITATLGEGRRRLIRAAETGAVIDPALVAAIGPYQAPASAQPAQGVSVEDLAPAQVSLVRTALAAGVKPARIAREFGIPAAAVRRLQPPTLRRTGTKRP